ncbi:Rhodanese-related sulfurtransferase [Cyclobacterium lianum]|uniref:Rhodanese-related sulfurtransferase n=1 Tax=Cyclobacterium lianum TaxID=388280 RepID=A0A1M7P084_9BACT|nr:Ca2+-dependent phosphoinositide-specific phospholipase C [Cyclobacterium lianum]SHN09840.1 Rhodanese-related sulfurtransferase [Cyclobacterium lianum]
MEQMYCRGLLIIVFSLFWACGQQPSADPVSLQINHIQLIGSHNSYKQAVPDKVMDQISKENPDLAAGLDYSHPRIWQQLDLGLRLLELDVYHDPEGGRFSSPMGAELTGEKLPEGFDEPGFKVFHVQDIDYSSHHPLLTDYLEELKNWSDLHPNHLPVFITLNAKDQNYPQRGFAEALAFDEQAFRLLDQVIMAKLGAEKLIRPVDISGTQRSLKEALTEKGWPDLEAAKGKFVWVLDEKEEKTKTYLSSQAAGESAVFFVTVPEDHPMAGIFILNDPVGQEAQIRDLVKKGFLVRTRADADTREARMKDTRRMEKAFESGAQLISTDYYLPDPRWEGAYQVRFPDNSYSRINPAFSAKNLQTSSFHEHQSSVIALDAESFALAEAAMDPLILDVRTQAEVDQGMISDASHIDFLKEDFGANIAKLPKNKPIMVYCKVGGRSAKAADQLLKAGFKNVYHLEGGIDDWQASGFPIVSQADPPG